MSIKSIDVISRNPDIYMRSSKNDLYRVQRNYDPDLHPMQEARHYKQALNAVKLNRVFARPFVGSLCHSESVSALCCHPYKLSCAITGTVEGELRVWDLQRRHSCWQAQAHNGQVHCITTASDGQSFFSVGNDRTIKQWSCEKLEKKDDLPMNQWLSHSVITGMSYHRYKDEFITCGEHVLLWDITAKAPKTSFDWSTRAGRNETSVVCIKFNPVETDVFCSSDHANNIVLYDTRVKEVKKLKMSHRINNISWNPMEAYVFTAASEDYNLYSYDIRNMSDSNALVNIHKGHTSAVLDLSYAPTGKEFCSGSYDKSVRIFNVEEGSSRDIYHTKRMFKVHCVLWSKDNKYIISGSSDHNARIWKAHASEKLGIMTQREQAAVESAGELLRKFKNFPEIRRIYNHRNLPKAIVNAAKEHRIIHTSTLRKEHNLRKHSRPGAVPFTPARKKVVVGLQDDLTVHPIPKREEEDDE